MARRVADREVVGGILADGKPRNVDEILAEAVARDLLPRDERKKYVYATLKAYVEKMIARGCGATRS